MMKCALERTNELFPGFKSLLEAKNYAEITNCCGELELVIEETDCYSNHPEDLCHFFCCYIAAYLITGDLNGARFLWRRVPTFLKSNLSEINGLWNIGKCLWLQEYSKLQSLTDISWSEDVEILVKDIKVSVFQRHLKQISDAYSRISFTSLCEMLFLDARQAVEACHKLNWEIEGDNEYVLPKPISANGPGEGERSFEKDMETLQQLSVYVANFEKKSFKVDLIANSSSVGPVGKKAGGY